MAKKYKTVTEKELAINLYNYYSKHMTTSEKENISRIVDSLNSFNKIKRFSFDYWIKYRKIIDIIFDNLNDKNIALNVLNNDIIRNQSNKDNKNKYFDVFSLLVSVVSLVVTISKRPMHPVDGCLFIFSVFIYIFFRIIDDDNLYYNYKKNILTEKYNQIKKEIKTKE